MLQIVQMKDILNQLLEYIPTDYEAEEATFFEAGGYARGSIYGWSSGHSRYPEGFTQALAEGMPFKFVIGDTSYEGIAHRSGASFYAGNKHIYNNLFPKIYIIGIIRLPLFSKIFNKKKLLFCKKKGIF